MDQYVTEYIEIYDLWSLRIIDNFAWWERRKKKGAIFTAPHSNKRNKNIGCNYLATKGNISQMTRCATWFVKHTYP